MRFPAYVPTYISTHYATKAAASKEPVEPNIVAGLRVKHNEKSNHWGVIQKVNRAQTTRYPVETTYIIIWDKDGRQTIETKDKFRIRGFKHLNRMTYSSNSNNSRPTQWQNIQSEITQDRMFSS